MQKTNTVNKNSHFFHFTAMVIALSLFVAGRFGFFDILGLKRLFEVILFFPIVILGLIYLLILPRIWLNPFMLLPVSYLLFQLYWRPELLELSDLTVAVLMISVILSLGTNFSDLLLRNIIKIATFFAFLGLIEFVILLLDPSLVSNILLFYDYYSGSTVPVIQNFLQLLGLSDGTSYHLWGMAVTRLRSFTSEPSLLVGYFLIPGALALTYNDRYRRYGIICILFCVCSFSGSVYASLAFSIMSVFLLLFRKPIIFSIFPFFLLVVFTWVLFTHFSELILMSKSFNGGYDFLDKTNSANMRFGYIRDFVPLVLSSPFGLEEEIFQPLGLILRSTAQCGIFGFAVSSLILYKLYSRIGFLLFRAQLGYLQILGLLIIYGSLIAGLIYLDNCFIQIYGFTLLLVIYNRLQSLLAANHFIEEMDEAEFAADLK